MKTFFQLISVVFHPLLVPTYAILMMMHVHPYAFGQYSLEGGMVHVLMVFFSTFFIPLVALLMLKGLGFVESLELKDPKERIAPYIITGTLLLWTYLNIRRAGIFPPSYQVFMLGAVIAVFLSFFINNFSKISAHAVGMGGFLGLMMNLANNPEFLEGHRGSMLFLYFFLLVLGSGLTASARLFLGAHEMRDVLGGLVTGMSTQVIAAMILLR